MATKAEKEKHASAVREEGLSATKLDSVQEIDLEIEAPGAANKVAEEGAQVIPNEGEYQKLAEQLEASRGKPENKLGKGGFKIPLKDPAEFENTMHVIVFNDATGALDEKTIKEEKFNTKDPEQTKTASMAMAMTLQTEVGATIVDDQPGKESIIQNFNSDNAKFMSQIASGYSIRNNFIQKMAPGDRSFHIVNWDAAKKLNIVKSFPKRAAAETFFAELADVPKIMVAGETGDIILANGNKSMVDQAVGFFYT